MVTPGTATLKCIIHIAFCSFFENFEYENFWIQKGKTEFLARLIGTEHVIDQITIEKRLVVPDLPVSLLFQTGYLTIKQQKIDDDDEQSLVLEIPNAEVKEANSGFLDRGESKFYNRLL
ncbi:7238_t:CDS:1 [Funneliformis mosseae]|uniref:7238_t:CDS:1 n=1 Tax=Funneliformis mosseae TaxID=27381 RepID=A0A9N9CXW6_FUNMO|nr:7238_t:CDS:1 [Funneliformis mosseae]